MQMATRPDGEKKGCIFQWRIENISHCWLKRGEKIKSPTFTADAVEGTKFSLWLCPKGDEHEKFMGVYIRRDRNCSGPDVVKLCWQLAFLGKDGSVLMEKPATTDDFDKDAGWGYTRFGNIERVYVTEREAFLPEDSLTVQCTLYNADEKPSRSNHLFSTTVIKVKRRSFAWKIEKINTLESCLRKKFKDYLISFDLLIDEELNGLQFDIVSVDESVNYISCKTSIIDSEGKFAVSDIQKYSVSDFRKGLLLSMPLFPKMAKEKKRQSMPNDVLTLDIEFVFSIVEHFGYKRNSKAVKEVICYEKSQKTAVLADDLKSMYNSGIFSDTKICTSKTTFPAHKNILSARSAVFRNMFSPDMKETNKGHVDITDFEDDTIQRMLLFMYTDSLEGLVMKNASNLYRIADKYEILSLKSKCSSYLIENLGPKHACSVLDMAVLHLDDDLKNSVQDYILGQRKHFFNTQEWKDFMDTHLKLAADIMHRKITKNLPIDE